MFSRHVCHNVVSNKTKNLEMKRGIYIAEIACQYHKASKGRFS